MPIQLRFRSPYLFLAIAAFFLGVAVCQQAGAANVLDNPNIDEKGILELKGQFLGSSYKAKIISIGVGDRIVLIPYDQETTGLDEVETGANVILQYRRAGDQSKALAIIPELVKIPDGVIEIQPEDLMEIINNPSREHGYMLVDCRPYEFYAETHLPTAVSIPWTESNDRKAALLPANKATELIFYCLGETCLLGPNSAALAVAAGYKNVKVLLSELSEWQENGGQLFSADTYIAEGNIVLIDLRPPSEIEAGYIPGAVSVPYSDLEEAEYYFPTKKSAPVVVYGNGKEVMAAVSVIKGWGFHQVSVVDGGFDGWLGRGNAIETGAIRTEIEWQRELGEGEISLEDFKRVIAENPADVIIVDVRTSEEAAKGKLQNSVHIPLSQLEKRIGEIPEDKDIILHCTTGARAKMAHSLLKQHRTRVRFLYGKVTCRKDKCLVRS